jgi:hypothetical protein
MTFTSYGPRINLSEDDKVTVVARWDIKLCKKPSYRTTITVLSNSRRQGTPTLAVKGEWLELIVNQLLINFFLRNSEQARLFDYLK